MGKGYRGVPSLPVQRWLDKREGLGTLERHWEEARSWPAGVKDGGVKDVLIPPGAPHWRPLPLAPLYGINGPGISGTTFPPVPPVVTLSLLVAGWRPAPLWVCFCSRWSLEPAPTALPRAGAAQPAWGQGQGPAALPEPRAAPPGPG